MNIKIVDPMPDHLVLYTFPFGSHTYGTATEKSDHDYIKIVRSGYVGSLILQYKDDKVDYLYVDMPNFLTHLENGGSCVFFEAIHTKEWQHAHPMDPLRFYTKTMAKCFLGFAKRDLDYPDRLKHVNRSLFMADKIIKKELINLTDVAKIEILTDVEFLKAKTKAMRDSLELGTRRRYDP